MADYVDFTIGSVRFMSGPCGWRDWLRYIPIVGKPLRRWPFFSGSEKRFYIKVKPVEPGGATMVGIIGQLLGPDQNPIERYDSFPEMVNERSDGVAQFFPIPHTYKVKTPWLGGIGQHRFDGWVFLNEHNPQSVFDKRTFINFDLKSSDTLFLAILAIVVSILIGVLSPLFGAWFGNKLFKQEIPSPVVVVVATPTPTPTPIPTFTPTATPLPASQSRPDSNAP